MKNGSVAGTELVEGDHERASSPPEGEDEFTDDDGTRYKWDKALRVWVPQVRLCFVNRINHSFLVSTILVGIQVVHLEFQVPSGIIYMCHLAWLLMALPYYDYLPYFYLVLSRLNIREPNKPTQCIIYFTCLGFFSKEHLLKE